MYRAKLILRSVAMMVACLAVTITFTSCEPAADDPIDAGTEQDADFAAFTFAGIDGSAEIDKDEYTVSALAKESVDLSDLVVEFTLSTGATAKVNGVAQTSKTTANDFSNPVTYEITSGDGETTQDWKVTIIKELPVGKKYITYNKPVTAYFIEYNGGAIAENANSFAGNYGNVIEAYEDKKFAQVSWWDYGEDRFECHITYPNGDWCFNWECSYGGNVWMLDQLNINENWEDEGYKPLEYPLDRFAFFVSKRKLGGGFLWMNTGGLSGLSDVAEYPDSYEMPNNTDVTQYYVRSEKVMDIECDVYEIHKNGGVATFWIDPATGFTLKLEAIDEQGNPEEDVNYEVTRLIVGSPDWDGEHLHPLLTDTILEP